MRTIGDEVMFEDALADSWSRDLDIAEVHLTERPMIWLGAAIAATGIVIALQVLYLGGWRGSFFDARATANLGAAKRTPAPRGIITDRAGVPIAENRAVSAALLDVREFLRDRSREGDTLRAIHEIFGLSADDVWKAIGEADFERSAEPIVLVPDLAPHELVAIKERNLPALTAQDTFTRTYPGGAPYASVLGYVGLATAKDTREQPELGGRDVIGKAGVELSYDDLLRGTAGTERILRDARGAAVGEGERTAPQIGGSLALTIDGGLQEYFYRRMADGLASLGRTTGVGLAMDPRNGEILALLNFPGFDNNVFVTPGKNPEKQALLTSELRPLFDRAVAGLYAPGSTVKPLVGVAALKENVITPARTIFSPGYLDVPNPYNPDQPNRFLDWRYQGDVDLSSALAQSSNVYFYTVGGGANGIPGLGIERLRQWWAKFGFGAKTGVDLPGDQDGFLPSPEWKEKIGGRPWLLGDTYNVSIGQGDLLVTPLQLIDYIAAVANGGMLYEPRVRAGAEKRVRADLTAFQPEIEEVRKGMRETVTSPLGTAHTMIDLPFAVAGKTGSAQVKANREENAFFVGYAPAQNPEIVILVLVENAREGSLNAVPIAKDVLLWYYEYHTRRSADQP